MTESQKKKRQFINEQIVHRKQYRKLLSMAVTAVVLGLLFGAMAGISFYASQGILNRNLPQESQGETIIIARDQDPQSTAGTDTESPDAEALPGETDSPEDSDADETPEAHSEHEGKSDVVQPEETENSSEHSGSEAVSDTETQQDPASQGEDSAISDSTDTGNPSGTETAGNENTSDTDGDGLPDGSSADGDGQPDGSTADGTDAREAASQESGEEASAHDRKEPENPEDISAALSLREMYDSVSGGFVTVTVRDHEATDLFGKPVTRRHDQFGVLILETEDYLYILTDGTGIDATSEVSVTYGNRKAAMAVYERDLLTNMAVLRARKEDFGNGYTVIPLGNSFSVSAAEYVWMAGSPDGNPGSVDYGVVSYVDSMDEVTDGYRQLFITNMQRVVGGSAVLFNQNCEIIGWISDYSCGTSNRVYAAGISPLKYVIEDLCSGISTAYLGVQCLTVNVEKAVETGLSTGLYVENVEQNSPAYMMGIQPGDRIVSINETSINNSRSLQLVMDELQSGKEIILMIERQGRDGEEPLRIALFVGKR